MKNIPQKSQDQGNIGEAFVKKYCSDNLIDYKKATKTQDLESGIDCFLDNIPTDVKNTKDIFFCQILLETGKINVRHPFKSSSLATHYCVVNVPKDMTKGKFVENINIRERLLRDFIKDEVSLGTFYKTLVDIEHREMKEFGISQSQACFKIKQMFLPLCKSNVNISYVEPEKADGEISFRMYVTKKSNEQSSHTEVRSILDKYKNKDKVISQVKEEIITITI